MSDENTAEERYCLEALAALRRNYERDAKPYLDRLTAIKAMRPSPAITLTLEQAREFVDFTMAGCDEGPRCRDCADNNGTCPHDGHKCGA